MPATAPRSARRVLRRVFRVGSLLGCVALGLAGHQLYRWLRPQGQALHQQAWEASYRERGLAVPAMPREGYWGSEAGHVEDAELGWRLRPLDQPGRIEVDARGYQHAASPPSAGPRWRLLVLGGSVAGGAYASTQAETWFARLARELGERGQPVEVTVVAAGSWVAGIELRAFRRALPEVRPHLVLFLNGLNDLTVQRKLALEKRPDEYLGYMRQAAELAAQESVGIVFALQPFLLQKPQPSRLERRILELSVKPPEVWPYLQQAYPYLRQGLSELASAAPRRWFVDCSGVLDGERETTFADLWHFSDPGHALVAERLAEGLAPVLAELGSE